VFATAAVTGTPWRIVGTDPAAALYDVGRRGGEEFLAILPDADAGAALLVAEPVSA
jgi:GGDEF domain-containing protein